MNDRRGILWIPGKGAAIGSPVLDYVAARDRARSLGYEDAEWSEAVMAWTATKQRSK